MNSLCYKSDIISKILTLKPKNIPDSYLVGNILDTSVKEETFNKEIVEPSWGELVKLTPKTRSVTEFKRIPNPAYKQSKGLSLILNPKLRLKRFGKSYIKSFILQILLLGT